MTYPASALRPVLALALLASLAACRTGTTTPGPVTGDFTIVVASPNTTIFLGATEQMVATASDSRVLSGTWGSDTPAVATVNSATGLVTAVGSGLTNVFFSAEGKTGLKPLRVVPNYNGRFTGTFRVDSCTDSGEVADQVDPCREAPPGTLVPFEFLFTQSGAVLSGRVIVLGTDAVPVFSTNIAANGDVNVDGTVTPGGGIQIRTTFQLSQRTPNVITGTIVQVWTAPGILSGQANISGSISSITR